MSIYESDDFEKMSNPRFLEKQRRLTVEKNLRMEKKRQEEILNLNKSFWSELENQAYQLLEDIEKDIHFLSVFKPHPAHDKLILLGEPVVPFLISLLREHDPDNIPAVWYLLSALREITGVHPVPMDHLGRLDLITQDWLKWFESEDL